MDVDHGLSSCVQHRACCAVTIVWYTVVGLYVMLPFFFLIEVESDEVAGIELVLSVVDVVEHCA